MTGAELVDRTLERIGEASAAAMYYTRAEVLAALNEGQRLFCWLSLCLEDSGVLTLSSTWQHAIITLPRWIAPLRMRSSTSRVLPATLAELDAIDPVWQAASGSPTRYVCLGFDLLGFYAAAGTVTATYARSPVDLVEGGSPEIPEEHHWALLEYAVPRLRAKEGGQEFQKVLYLLDRFLDAAQQMGNYVRARSRTQKYDRLPFELAKFDRSRLIEEMVNGR